MTEELEGLEVASSYDILYRFVLQNVFEGSVQVMQVNKLVK